MKVMVLEVAALGLVPRPGAGFGASVAAPGLPYAAFGDASTERGKAGEP